MLEPRQDNREGVERIPTIRRSGIATLNMNIERPIVWAWIRRQLGLRPDGDYAARA